MSTQKLASKDTPTSEAIIIGTDGVELGGVIYPTGSTPVAASSGNVAAAIAAAALPQVAAKTNYLAGFEVSGAGATTGLPVSVTVVGILGGTLTYTYVFEAGVLVGNKPLVVAFNPPLPASAVNVAITVSCPSGGSGNTNNTTNVHGFVK